MTNRTGDLFYGTSCATEKEEYELKKHQIKYLAAVFIAVCFLGATVITVSGDAYAAGTVSIKVLDPRGELFSTPASPINARLKTLEGKKIGILNNTKPGADYFLPYLMQVLKESYPTIEFKVWNISYNLYPNKARDLKELAAWSDGVIGLLGD
jgi:hypothetical protein